MKKQNNPFSKRKLSYKEKIVTNLLSLWYEMNPFPSGYSKQDVA
jgi:hypothetical protein